MLKLMIKQTQFNANPAIKTVKNVLALYPLSVQDAHYLVISNIKQMSVLPLV